MLSFAAGVVRFQKEAYPKKKALFERLSRGQSPEALFITCSDSRIETAMLTQTDPGALFICRNAGNIVPPHTSEHTGAMTASIEFAVAALNVPHIIICGHTECGAMQGVLDPVSIEALPHVGNWLGYAGKAAAHVKQHGASLNEKARMQMLIERNVVIQLEHLRNHPAVAAALRKGAVTLHGWVYNIASGDVAAYDAARDAFAPFEAFYAKDIAASNKPG